MSKPNTSVVDEPRPLPNSKRPSVMWSSRATVSATRAGWFTLGVYVEDGRPDVDALGAGRQVGQVDLGPGHVAVLVEEVVLGAPHVLDAGAVGGDADLDVAHDALVLGHGVDVALVAGHEQLGEDAEFHAGSFRRHSLSPPRWRWPAGARIEHVLVFVQQSAATLGVSGGAGDLRGGEHTRGARTPRPMNARRGLRRVLPITPSPSGGRPAGHHRRPRRGPGLGRRGLRPSAGPVGPGRDHGLAGRMDLPGGAQRGPPPVPPPPTRDAD